MYTLRENTTPWYDESIEDYVRRNLANDEKLKSAYAALSPAELACVQAGGLAGAMAFLDNIGLDDGPVAEPVTIDGTTITDAFGVQHATIEDAIKAVGARCHAREQALEVARVARPGK